VAPSPWACTAFKMSSLTDIVGACWPPRALRRPSAAGAVLALRNEDTGRGRLQATGRVEAEPRIESSTSPAASSTWPPCRSKQTSSS
jgi:hypothetical protein